MSPVLLVLVACAILLLFFGVLLLVGVAFLWFALGRGGDDEFDVPTQVDPMARQPVMPAAPSATPPPAAPAPPPPSGALGGMEPLFQKEEDEVAKTEVFTRGSLSLDWDEDDEEENATEIFRAGDDFDLG